MLRILHIIIKSWSCSDECRITHYI